MLCLSRRRICAALYNYAVESAAQQRQIISSAAFTALDGLSSHARQVDNFASSVENLHASLIGVGAYPAPWSSILPVASETLLMGLPGMCRRGASSASGTRALAAEATLPYTVEIFTGDFRMAGTDDEVSVRLIGQRGSSQEHALHEDDEDDSVREFKRGSRRLFTLACPDIGEVLQVKVCLRRRTSDISMRFNNWYLDRIHVVSPSGLAKVFAFGDWLGESDDGDLSETMECELKPIDNLVRSAEGYFDLPEPLQIACGAYNIPNPDTFMGQKRSSKGVMRKHFGYGGEDAYFCAGPTEAGLQALGVSDGVYMWRLQGIDAGLFSQRIMQSCAESLEGGETDVNMMLRTAAATVKQEDVKGSATVCIVLVNTKTGALQCANLGDSGFCILRRVDGELEVMYKSPQQEHHFGCPYQLGHQETADSPEAAMLITRTVSSGDILLIGSDGLFDNVHDHEIVAAAEQGISSMTQAQARSTAGARMVAQCIASKAFENSLDKRRDTPYSQGATEEFDMVYSGGKADDITVVAGIIA